MTALCLFLEARNDRVDEPTKKPWLRKKRWRAAAALWLASPVLYVLGVGPLQYAYTRGWLSIGFCNAYSAGLRPFCVACPSAAEPLWEYQGWCQRLGDRHAASD